MTMSEQDLQVVVLDGADGTRYAVPTSVVEQYAITDEGRAAVGEASEAEVSGFNLGGFNLVGIIVIDANVLQPTTFYKHQTLNLGGSIYNK
jgi:hypothetical protein